MEKVILLCDWEIGSKRKPCGEQLDEPKTFIWDGVTYRMMVCEKHTAEAQSRIEPIIRIAKPVSTRVGRATRAAMVGRKGEPITTADVRAWAVKEGYEVATSGRVPQKLVDQYKAATT